jgi:hypothetical protein
MVTGLDCGSVVAMVLSVMYFRITPFAILNLARMSATDFLFNVKYWGYRINEYLIEVLMDDAAQIAWIFT